MQQQSFIKYQIQQSKSYRGTGDIQDIKNKLLNRYFQLYSDSDNEFQIDLRFEAPSIIVEINMRLMNVLRFSIQLIDNKNNLIEEIKKTNTNKDDQIVLMPKVLEPVRYAKLKIEKNSFIDKRLGIRYVIFKGINDQVEKKSNNKNSKDNQTLEIFFQKKTNPMKDPRSVESKEIFKNREKEKVIKQDLQKLMDFSDFQNGFSNKKEKIERDKASLEKSEQKIKKKVKQNEQDNLYQLTKKSYQKHRQYKQKEKQDTQLAIALSKSQHNRYEVMQDDQIDSHTIKMQVEEPLPAGFEEYLNQKIINNQIEEQPQRNYRTMEFNEDYIAFFSQMSPEWFAAQKKAQILHNVREEQRITNFIRIKWLYNTEIYIEGFENWRMDELHHQAKTLGCKILDQPKNSCIAIVSKPICEKLKKKHKEWKEIKYLATNYLEDCISRQQKLNYRGYYLNV